MIGMKFMSKDGKLDKNAVCYAVSFLLVLGFIAFLCFYRLDAKYVDPYDEARHGVNAYEMLKQGTLTKSTYGYETDYYNLKPPLSMWCIMLSFVLFGKNVFALRAYSAICYILLAAAVGLFVKKHYGALESIFSMVFLAVNTAPFTAHMIRAGDADSLYVLLFTLAMLCMMEIPQKQSRIYLCGLFFALAFLCKSFHAGIIVAIGGLFLILTGEIKKLKIKTIGIFTTCTVAPIAVWGIMRLMEDGVTFFKQMLLVDVLNRTNGTLNNNKQPFGWYAEYFFGAMGGEITVYLWALFICMVGVILFHHLFTGRHYKKVIGYILWVMIPFVAFSAVTNKLVWYMYPITIPLLMCAGIVVAKIIKRKDMAPVVRCFVLGAVVILLLHYSKGEIQMIRSQGGNEFQEFVTQVSKEYVDTKDTAYLALTSNDENQNLNTTWAQQDVYLAEVYGDLTCENGGMDSFVESAEGILFVDRAAYMELSDDLQIDNGNSDFEIIEGNNYLAIIK